MPRPDILVFMSDQHTPVFSAYAGGIARTPNIEKLCEDGTNFTAAYTACPLCVPARTSMLLGKLPSNTGIFSNEGAIPETQATFLHSLAAVGYETVLIGRMHFLGTNQRHGFLKRLVGDITPVSWARPEGDQMVEERGVFKGCFAERGCTEVIGGGDSPVLEYDKAVIKAAVEYLQEPHEKPQCIVVGTYGPHFPYVAPEELYLYYKDKIEVPDSFKNLPEYFNPILINKAKNVTEETVIKARAAYFGMIETIDAQMGQVRSAFNKYIEQNNREGIFTYISDHGDQAGEKRLFGKTTFFESSARIPIIMEGKGITKGININTPASIIDLGPTLCELAGTVPPPGQDGRSLVPELTGAYKDSGINIDKDRVVLAELINDYDKGKVAARMARKGNYKYITYFGFEEYDMLFDIANDPKEEHNLAESCKDVLKELKEAAYKDWEPQKILENHKNYIKNIKLVKEWEKAFGPNDTERWNKNPEYARVMPKVE